MESLKGQVADIFDAVNAQASIIHELLSEVSRYGTANVKRAYGDWTTTNRTNGVSFTHEPSVSAK